MLSTNRHERQSVHPWYMRRPPLVSASLRKRRFLCLERERRNPAAWTMQQSAVTTPAAAYPLRPIRYYLPLYLPSTTRPTDQPTNGLEMSKRKSARSDIIIIIIHIAITQRTNAKSTSCISTYLPFSPSDTRDLPDLTLPYLTSPHLFGSHPKKKNFLTDPSIHPSIREDRSHRHQLSYDIQVSEIQ